MYLIKNYCHRSDIPMGRHGFMIDLHPSVAEMVKNSEIDQAKVDHMLSVCGRAWLDAAGFNTIFDPDNCGFDRDESLPPGPRAEPSHKPNIDMRVKWGKWGPEHITVPGNACGLDVERSSFGCAFRGGASLVPHNVDSLAQKYLLTIVFTEMIYTLQLLQRI